MRTRWCRRRWPTTCAAWPTRDPPIDVVLVPRANVILGRWLRYGNNWPARHARFFRPGALLMTDRIHKSIAPAPGARKSAAGGRQAEPRHLALPGRQPLGPRAQGRPIHGHRGAPGLRARPAHATDRRPAPEAAVYFWRQYIRGGGYRDGTMGLAVALTRTYYRVLAAAKLWELPRREKRAREVAALRERLLARWEKRLSDHASPRARRTYQRSDADRRRAAAVHDPNGAAVARIDEGDQAALRHRLAAAQRPRLVRPTHGSTLDGLQRRPRPAV